LLAVVLAAFALRLHELARQDIWWDEARNLDVALRPLNRIAIAPELDIQPPLYYYLLHGWLAPAQMQVGSAPALLAWWARWLSVAAGTLLPLLTAVLATLAVAPSRRAQAAAAAAVVGALAPFWLAESQETRMYTVGLAFLAAAAYFLVRAVLIPEPAPDSAPNPPPNSVAQPGRTQPHRRRHLIAFTLLSTAALATHYNVLFIVATWYLWWGVTCLAGEQRFRRLLTPLVTGSATLLMLAPLAPIALRQIPGYENPNLTVPTVAQYLVANVQGHLAGYAWDATRWSEWAPWWLWGLLALAAIGLVAGPVASLRAPARPRGLSLEAQAQIFLLVWLIGGLGLYYLAVLDRGAFNVRYSAFVTPALFALVGAGIAGLGRLWLPALLLAATGLASFAWADLYDARFDREDIAGVTRWLRDEATAGDLILVDQKYPFGFYYERFAIDPAATPQGSEAAPARYLFVDINTLDVRLNEWAADAERVFWVQWFESDTDPRHAVPYLLAQGGSPAGEELYQGYRVNWWQMAPPSDFAVAPDPVPLRIVVPPVESVALSLPQGAPAGDALPVAIRWQLSGDAPAAARPLKARVALYDGADNRLAQADERLLNDRHLAPDQWLPDEQPLNVYLLQADEPPPPGRYEVRVLVYDGESLEPLTLLDEAGNPAGIEATLGFVKLE
jgi:hypothetical protein